MSQTAPTPVEPEPVLFGWRRTVRTVLQTLIALAAAAPVIYSAVVDQSPEQAAGAGAVVLAVAGAVTRIMALPVVEDTLQRLAPWLSAQPPVHGWADDELDDLDEDEDVLLPPDGDLPPRPSGYANGV